jgi:hypothetical protein
VDDALPHAGFPEFSDVVGSALNCAGTIRFGIEKIADVVGHFDQSFSFHDGRSLRVVFELF